MSKNTLLAASLLGLSCLAVSPAHALSVTLGGDAVDGQGLFIAEDLLNSFAGDAFELTFDQEDGSCLSVVDANAGGLSGDFSISNNSVPGVRALPLNDVSCYLSVPDRQAPGSATLALGASFDYFGVYWGSIDDYNTLELLAGSTVVATVRGSDVLALTSGLTGVQDDARSNQFVNVTLNGIFYDSVRFSSSLFAFEVDNLTFAHVDEPASLALLGAGLITFGAMRRRRA
jgi:hypothetical protein